MIESPIPFATGEGLLLRYLFKLFLMTVLAQPLFSFVRRYFMTFPLLPARHILHLPLKKCAYMVNT